MKRCVLLSLLLSSLLSAAEGNDLVLWYDEPAKNWGEALPIGNGQMGAMVFGGVDKERIQFNESTIWTGKPHFYVHKGAVKVLPRLRELLYAGKQKEAHSLAGKKFMSVPLRQKSYQPCGDLYIETRSETSESYRRQLDIDSGIAKTEWKSGGVSFTRETFASHPAGLVVTRQSSDTSGALHATVSFACEHQKHTVSVEDDHTLVLSGSVQDDGVKFEARAVVLHQGGTLSVKGNSISISGANSFEIRLTAASNVESWKKLGADPSERNKTLLTKSKKAGFDNLLEKHMSDHRRLFRRVSLDLGSSTSAGKTTDARIKDFQKGGDPGFAALLFQYGRYLMIACSREGGQPANLQGIWNDKLKPSWESKYTININYEMNYWPAWVGNLAECEAPFFSAMHELRESGTVTAKEHYGARGWVAHHNFDLWRGTAPINSPTHGIWPTGGAWVATHIWEHYLFTRNKNFLRKSWPLLRDASLFFVDTLTEDPRTGNLISGPSNSPEQGGLVMGPTMDHQIIRALFDATARAARILGVDEALARKLDDMSTRIAPNKIGKHGQLQEWLEDRDDPANKHRHVSHLWGVYPGREINWQTKELFKAARQSLIFRGDAATGWSMGWKTNLWARFLDGDHAYAIVSNLINPVGRKRGQGGLYPNMFDAHPPFQVDGNFGVCAGIAEMLLQSHIPAEDNGRVPRFIIHLLPALPSTWPTGKVTGLRARGGMTVDLAWESGQFTTATLTSSANGPVSIRFGRKTITLNASNGKPLMVSAADFN